MPSPRLTELNRFVWMAGCRLVWLLVVVVVVGTVLLYFSFIAKCVQIAPSWSRSFGRGWVEAERDGVAGRGKREKDLPAAARTSSYLGQRDDRLFVRSFGGASSAQHDKLLEPAWPDCMVLRMSIDRL